MITAKIFDILEREFKPVILYTLTLNLCEFSSGVFSTQERLDEMTRISYSLIKVLTSNPNLGMQHRYKT